MVTLAEELPFAAAVEKGYLEITCSSCFSDKGNKSRCIGCKVVSYCDRECQKKDWIDHKSECSFLKKFSPNIPPAICRLMARIAMKLKRPDAKEPVFNGRVYDDLMDHCDEIKKDAERMKYFSLYSQVLCLYMGDKVPDSDLLLSIFGKIEINSFGISSGNQNCGHGLYLGLSAHDYSCLPDVRVNFHGSKASLHSPDTNKKYSKALTVTYTGPLCSNEDRQKKLHDFYYFTCKCELCSDPSLDFLHNSDRSSCCPDSYCLLDPDAKELTCNKCGSVSGITVKEAVAANKEAKDFVNESPNEVRLCLSMASYLQTLIEAYEKFSKILSSLNLNLLLLGDKLVISADSLDKRSPVSRKYVEKILHACSRYLPVGDMKLSQHLMIRATSMAFERPPTQKVLGYFEEAYAVFSASHGPNHHETSVMDSNLSQYRIRYEVYASRGVDLMDR